MGEIFKIESERDENSMKITVHMGVEAANKVTRYLFLTGKVHLKFGLPTKEETLGAVLKELQNANNVRVIIE